MKAKIFLICALGLLLGGCKKNHDILIWGDYVSLYFNVEVNAPDGTNLLDQNNPTHLDLDKIKVSYINVNGKEVFIKRFMPNDLRDGGFANVIWKIDTIESSILVAGKPIPKKTEKGRHEDISYKMKIYWNDKVVDTFQTVIAEDGGADRGAFFQATEVIYNDEVVWKNDPNDMWSKVNEFVYKRVLDHKDL